MSHEDFLDQPMPEPKPASVKPKLQSPQTLRKAAAALPKFAQAPWPQPPRPQGAPPILVPPPDEITQKISETHGGVQRLQTLLDPIEIPNEKGKLDTIIDLLETVVGQQRTLTERLSWMLQRQASVMKALNLRIPNPDQET
jgi:hypothetical protein